MLLLQCSHVTTHVRFGTPVVPQAHRTVYVDGNFRDDEFKVIKEASDEWSAKTAGLAVIEVKRLPSPEKPKFTMTTDDILLEKADSASSEILFLDYSTDATLFGLYRVEGNHSIVILVTDRFSSTNEYRTVVLHEIGHALGLEHNSVRGTVMYRDHAHVGDHLVREDLKQFCAIYRCDVDELTK